MPKYQSLPVFVNNISGSRAFASFLVKDGASMTVAPTNVPGHSEMPWSARWPFTSIAPRQ